ncbi:MAG: 4Fe-4S binding protein [Candidatus Omnitrophota bacterium]
MPFGILASINFKYSLVMERHQEFPQRRRFKQFLMAPVFVAILVLGWFYPLLGYFIPLCMLFGIALSFTRGRKWCDWYCPRGSFYDVVVSAVSPKRNIPSFLKSMYFRIGVLLVLLLVMAFQLFRYWPDPHKIGAFFVILITITTAAGIILALIFHQRTWCLICPLGTMANLIGGSRRPLKIDSDLCGECKLCAKVCPVQIRPYLFKKEGLQPVKDGDCLKCGMCVIACPKKALKFSSL